MDWLELTVTVSTMAVEAVAELFYGAGCSGVVIEDVNLLRQYIQSGAWDDHDFALPGESDTAAVIGYFARDELLAARKARLEEGLRELLEFFPGLVIRLKDGNVREEDWATAWKTYFKPVKVGDRIVIKPTWEDYAGDEAELIIQLDPGMAFGTGTHPTTSLCIRALERSVRPGQLVYDIGTGSGVLAIAAALLGARVKAVDLDPVAVKAAKENTALNGLSDKIDVQLGDLAQVLPDPADLVVANIIADVIIILAEDLERVLKPGGICLASGIIAGRSQDVEQALQVKGLKVEQVDEQDGWVLIQARREADVPLSGQA